MCQLIHYQFCVETHGSDKVLPKDKVNRCPEWPQLMSAVKNGGSEARQRLERHMKRELLIILILYCSRGIFTKTRNLYKSRDIPTVEGKLITT